MDQESGGGERFLDGLRAVVAELTGSQRTADLVTRRVHADWAGQQVYVPIAPPLTDAEIMSEFDGANHETVIRRLRISRSRLYRAIRASSRPPIGRPLR